jgi:hypothetical protein
MSHQQRGVRANARQWKRWRECSNRRPFDTARIWQARATVLASEMPPPKFGRQACLPISTIDQSTIATQKTDPRSPVTHKTGLPPSTRRAFPMTPDETPTPNMSSQAPSSATGQFRDCADLGRPSANARPARPRIPDLALPESLPLPDAQRRRHNPRPTTDSPASTTAWRSFHAENRPHPTAEWRSARQQIHDAVGPARPRYPPSQHSFRPPPQRLRP